MVHRRRVDGDLAAADDPHCTAVHLGANGHLRVQPCAQHAVANNLRRARVRLQRLKASGAHVAPVAAPRSRSTCRTHRRPHRSASSGLLRALALDEHAGSTEQQQAGQQGCLCTPATSPRKPASASSSANWLRMSALRACSGSDSVPSPVAAARQRTLQCRERHGTQTVAPAVVGTPARPTRHARRAPPVKRGHHHQVV